MSSCALSQSLMFTRDLEISVALRKMSYRITRGGFNLMIVQRKHRVGERKAAGQELGKTARKLVRTFFDS